MTMTSDDAAGQQALEWAIRVGDPSFEDWDAFSSWLADDPGHAERYDRIETLLARAAAVTAAIPPSGPALSANDEPPIRDVDRRRVDRRWAGGAIAAAIVGVIGFNLWSDRPQPYEVATAAGQQRTVALADGSAILLAAGSRVRLDRAVPRSAEVEAGSALFRVRHDASAPFVVRAGELEVVDVGTVFDVTRDAGVTRVAVAEGAVVIDPKGAALRLDPGQAARVADGRIERQDVIPADVGRWREGVLRFDDASLAEVAAALTRIIGRGIELAPSLTATRFSGTVDVRRIGDDPALLGRLLDVSVRRTATGWRLEPHS